MYIILIFIIAVLGIISLIALLMGSGRYSFIRYYARGRGEGFSFGEARELKSIAGTLGFSEPASIFWNAEELEQVIKIVAARGNVGEGDREFDSYLDRLFQFRKKLEYEQPGHKYGLGSTKMISRNQRLRILVRGVGVFNSSVVDNNDRFMVCSFPIGIRLPKGFSWQGKHVSVYFWKREDAGYVYDTFVIDEIQTKGIPTLHLAHTEAMFRTQKRKSRRIVSKIPAYLYLVNRLEGAFEKPERSPGMKCVIQDVSEDGFSLLIGGKAREGLLVKAQFYVGEDHIVMSGTVRAVDFSSDKNHSVIHVEAVKPSPRMSNLIRTFVYDLYSEKTGDADGPFA
ncbi:MAG: PilZ domain-containing protein [Spirochaetes bacterium]|nr:PilZ domain-containing protein [Spirochaetota bacterium]